ncbi:MAG: hypothetical protein JJ850_08610 [Kordiimonadaceae bacterium]|nr:hypothetical protein [Kordiimonadaceae bacterium]MBO6569189.1 hypothetical protein [Kordiimonadaceae bacterium]MBO6964665.1 hypothetical protein [Kordiimonadaceae bacterium]
MAEASSRAIESNQSGPHERLEEVVSKHLRTVSRRPVADHTRLAFEAMQQWLGAGNSLPIILDACCGVGDSTRNLAAQHSDHLVVGIDKSIKRLSKERAVADPSNMLLLQADLNDFYRLLVQESIQIARHYILYPNPWPKAAHLGRRWHGAPVFSDIIKVKGPLELRSNWKLYLEEFQLALKVAGIASELEPFTPETPISPFEAKYHASGQKLWRLTAHT